MKLWAIVKLGKMHTKIQMLVYNQKLMWWEWCWIRLEMSNTGLSKSSRSYGEVTEQYFLIQPPITHLTGDFLSLCHSLWLQAQWEAHVELWMKTHKEVQTQHVTQHPACPFSPSSPLSPCGSASNCWITDEQQLIRVDSLSLCMPVWLPVAVPDVQTFAY